MTPTGDRTQSTRLVARQVSELMLARGRAFQAHVGQDQLAGLIYGVMLSASVAHLPFREPAAGRWLGAEQAARLGRPVSATSVAQSIKLSLTTVRRRAAALVEAGLLTRSGPDFLPADSAAERDGLSQRMAANRAALSAVLHALVQAQYAPALQTVAAGVDRLPDGVVERVALIFNLRALETHEQPDLVRNIVAATLVAANIRHITQTPELARRYSGEGALPPDDVRRPVALRALAREADMPFETVRRRISAMIAQGEVQRVGDGLIVPSAVVQGYSAYNLRLIAHFEQMLATLVALARET